jgi:hypothetical protein
VQRVHGSMPKAAECVCRDVLALVCDTAGYGNSTSTHSGQQQHPQRPPL